MLHNLTTDFTIYMHILMYVCMYVDSGYAARSSGQDGRL